MLNVECLPTMIPKSIKWRLQLWYGLILVVLLAGFGFTAYQLERGRLFGRIDNELHRRMEILAGALRRPPPRGLDTGDLPFNRPAQGHIPRDGLQGQNPPPRVNFRLPPQAGELFSTNDPNNFYFIIQSRTGEEIARSQNAPDGDVLFGGVTEVGSSDINSPPGPRTVIVKPRSQTIGASRTAVEKLPSGDEIWAGCTIAPELKQLHQTALNLTVAGGLILLVGLAGGWWLVSRSLKPISSISAAAVKISAGDLSQRINVAEAESELGQLALVLNSTFARLEAAFAEQRQFTSDAAHELRTPVAVILTQTQTALNRERDAASYRETVEACQRAAQRMRRLIESLLALARFDAGQEVLKRLRFDLSKTVEDCVNLVQPLADERGVKMTAEIAPLEIAGDSERLAQVVTNLLTNAIQYNQRDGEVRVRLELQSGLAVLTVADTGQGIAPGNLPLVFGRFFRADRSRTGAGNAGLGLAISKAIVEAHGGTIGVSSEVGGGATFTVRLPIGV
jgi:two-component system, OmpR family, sensor kinase